MGQLLCCGQINLPMSNPKAEFHNINAHIKFGENRDLLKLLSWK